MRTTLAIDDDLLAVAKTIARSKSQSLGKVISDLARRGLNATIRVDAADSGGFPVFKVPENAHPITLEDVQKDLDEI